MDNNEESIIYHLQELRSTLLRCVVAVGILFIPIFFFISKILNFLISIILKDTGIVLNYFSPVEVFILQLKFALIFDFVLCFPYIAKQLWNFLLPALYENERHIIRSAVISSSVLFVFGILFAFFLIIPFVIKFGMSFSSPNINPVFGISNVLNLVLWLVVTFGIMFQVPLVVYFLIKSNIISTESLYDKRPYVIVGLLIVAAILTPPDVVSQLMLFIPTYALYELGILYSKYSIKKS